MQRGGRTQRQKTEQPGGQQHRRITGMAVPGRAQADGDELGLDRTEEVLVKPHGLLIEMGVPGGMCGSATEERTRRH